MLTVDTRGRLCPEPIIAAKKALVQALEGESFAVLTDNQTSLDNLSRFLTDNGTEFSVRESGGFWTLTITKGAGAVVRQEAEDYCSSGIPHLSKGDFVIAISSDIMGSGNDELGALLMGNFIKAIRDLDHLPSKIVFYNSGVMLGKDDSPVIDHLREIEKMEVSLLLCATCVSFYSLAGKIHVGTLSNMFEIAQAMASASNVIKP